MLPALQNSGRAKWGSARADRILKARVSDKNGISFAGSETLQISTAAPDFCFSRAQRLWEHLRDLGSPSLHRNLQKRCHRILSRQRNLSADFSPFFCRMFFYPPQTVCLGSGICCLPLFDWDERGAWFVGCSWHTVPSWSAANEVQDLLRLRARAAARPVQGMRRQQQLLGEHGRQRYCCNCKECGGSSFCEHRRQRSQCKECGRSSFCEHGRPRDYCNCRVRWQ